MSVLFSRRPRSRHPLDCHGRYADAAESLQSTPLTHARAGKPSTGPGGGSAEPTSKQTILVVNADDLGLSESANAGVFLAHSDGIVTSASLAVTGPSSEGAAVELPKHPKLGVGLHFCLTAGKAVAEPKAVPDLVDAQGFLRRRFAALLLALSGRRRPSLLEQIAIELEAQIERARSWGIKLDHLNSERHVHLIPPIFEVVAGAAERHGVPHVRVIDDIGAPYMSFLDRRRAALDGGTAKAWLLGRFTRQGKRFRAPAAGLDVKFATLLCTGRMYRVLPAIWRRPPEGITEVAIHPGLPHRGAVRAGLGNRQLSRYLASPQRRMETEVCLSLKRAETAARLATFAEAYGHGIATPPAPLERETVDVRQQRHHLDGPVAQEFHSS